MASVRPYEDGDIEKIELRDEEKKLINSYREPSLHFFKETAEEGVSMTMICKEGILAVITATEFFEGMYEITMVPSIHIPKHKKSFMVIIKTFFLDFVKRNKPYRIQIQCVFNDLHSRFFTALGFECEGVKKHYLPDGTCYADWAWLGGK